MIVKRGQHWHLDVTVQGNRYREALGTTDQREAKQLEKKRVAEILSGKGASKTGRDFARKPFGAAADEYLEWKAPQVSPSTTKIETQRLRPLRRFFKDKVLHRIKAADVTAYQKARREAGVSGRTINIELGVLRRMMRRGRVWNLIAEDVTMDRENTGAVAKVLTPEEKRHLFAVAGSRESWLLAHCAAVLAASTTCRGVELRHLRWQDVDLFGKTVHIRRSKTATGQRLIPLNGDALASLARLRERAEGEGAAAPEHFIFPACESGCIDPSRPQTTWRTAWRNLVKAAARLAGRAAAREALEHGTGLAAARAAYRQAAGAFHGFRFHDLRHQAITELAEAGASDATLMALAGHLSRRMMEHYSHVRMAAKRDALAKLESGLMAPRLEERKPVSKAVN